VDALRDPAFYPHRPAAVELRETHISIVFIAGERVYKLKKPLVLPFLDYGSLERRFEMCREEVRLNRRLAPDAYLGVRSVVDDAGKLRLGDELEPGAVEFLVEMRTLPQQRTLASLVAAGAASDADLRAVGARLAEFHASAERAPAERGSLAAVKRTTDETFETLLSAGGARFDRDVVAAQRFCDAFLVANRGRLRERERYVRDGHGDLRAEHVVLDRGVQVFDCVEFDPALRQTDVAADLAFLVMDLEALGAPAAARTVADAYRDAGGDYGGDDLLAFHAADRALVRAKVALVRAAQQGADAAAETVRASTLIRLAERFRWRARQPLTIVACGAAASGKSTLAAFLSERSGLSVVSSDVTRKRLAGLDPAERAPAELYGEAANRSTYRELARAARGTIVDATYRRRRDRDELRVACAPVVFVECRAPAALLAERARRRARDPARVSDATAEIAERQLAEFEPLDEVPPSEHLIVRTDRDVAAVAADVEALLDVRWSAQPRSGGGAKCP
jgi:uncharacterized protein